MNEECNHKGQWRGLGTLMINSPNGLIIAHNIFCKKCGETRLKTVPFSAVKSPTIAVATMKPSLKRGGN